MTETKPRVALTLGDVAGIGPEIIARIVSDPRVLVICRPLIVGHPEIVHRAAQAIGQKVELNPVRLPFSSPADPQSVASSSPPAPLPPGEKGEKVDCWNPAGDDVLGVPLGRIDARAGRAAYEYLVAATRAALAGDVDAIVTAPLSKAALHAAGLAFPGHTEILAEECGVAQVAMMLYLPPGGLLQNPFGLGVAHVTLHTSIRSVPDLLTTPRILETIHLLDRFLKSIGCAQPRVGVCALNPHAGEEGIFGDEEATVIVPAVAAAKQAGVNAAGPIPADALLRRAAAGEFDGVAAMYHDQGHIALKLIGFDRAVNITLGLPIIRTSPSHGTAFDIAGKGIARTDGMAEAVRIAAKLYTQLGKA